MTKSIDQLEREIERVVREHVAACHRGASAALERAFGTGSTRRKSPATPTTRKPPETKRTSSEIAELGERLYAAICAHPGETMTVLAPRIGLRARELHRPMTVLRGSGRIRSAGQKQQMRYFPMASGAPGR
jgi:hypothetical protein